MNHHAAPPVIAGPVVHPVPQGFDLQGILPDHDLLQPHGVGVRSRRGHDGLDDGGDAVHFGDAGDATVRMDEDEAVVV
jgi:hypothetical protein